MDKYDSRTKFNRSAIYVGTVLMTGLAGATGGLASFGSASSAAVKVLPIVSSFVGSLFGIFDNRQLAVAYTEGANNLRQYVAAMDPRFLREPTLEGKKDLVFELGGQVAQVISTLEDTRNEIAGTIEDRLESAAEMRKRLEVAMRIRPSIAKISPVVTGTGVDQKVTITGSGFDPGTTVIFGGVDLRERDKTLGRGGPAKANVTYTTPGSISFTAPRAATTTSSTIVVRNAYSLTSDYATSFVQAPLTAVGCELRSVDLDGQTLRSLLIKGSGFQRDGGEVKLLDAAGAAIKVENAVWKYHEQWEVLVKPPTAPITVASIQVTNTNAIAVPGTVSVGALGACATIP